MESNIVIKRNKNQTYVLSQNQGVEIKSEEWKEVKQTALNRALFTVNGYSTTKHKNDLNQVALFTQKYMNNGQLGDKELEDLVKSLNKSSIKAEEAADLLINLIILAKHNPSRLFKVGGCTQSIKNFIARIGEVVNALSEGPYEALAKEAIALVYYFVGSIYKSREHYLMAAEQSRKAAEEYKNLDDQQIVLSNSISWYKNAINNLCQEIKVRRINPEKRSEAAKYLLNLIDQANELYKNYFQGNVEKRAEFFHDVGKQLVWISLDEAYSVLNQAALIYLYKVDVRSAGDIFDFIGDLYAKKGKFEFAEEFFKKSYSAYSQALKLDPQDEGCQERLLSIRHKITQILPNKGTSSAKEPQLHPEIPLTYLEAAQQHFQKAETIANKAEMLIHGQQKVEIIYKAVKEYETSFYLYCKVEGVKDSFVLQTIDKIKRCYNLIAGYYLATKIIEEGAIYFLKNEKLELAGEIFESLGEIYITHAYSECEGDSSLVNDTFRKSGVAFKQAGNCYEKAKKEMEAQRAYEKSQEAYTKADLSEEADQLQRRLHPKNLMPRTSMQINQAPIQRATLWGFLHPDKFESLKAQNIAKLEKIYELHKNLHVETVNQITLAKIRNIILTIKGILSKDEYASWVQHNVNNYFRKKKFELESDILEQDETGQYILDEQYFFVIKS